MAYIKCDKCGRIKLKRHLWELTMLNAPAELWDNRVGNYFICKVPCKNRKENEEK